MNSLAFSQNKCKVNEKFVNRMHFSRKNVQKLTFNEYLLKKVEKSGGLWGELIIFAPRTQI